MEFQWLYFTIFTNTEHTHTHNLSWGVAQDFLASFKQWTYNQLIQLILKTFHSQTSVWSISFFMFPNKWSTANSKEIARNLNMKHFDFFWFWPVWHNFYISLSSIYFNYDLTDIVGLHFTHYLCDIGFMLLGTHPSKISGSKIQYFHHSGWFLPAVMHEQFSLCFFTARGFDMS